jgi:ubiquinone/menaquinone biosynthesis C-methylase UbiE
LSTQQLYDQWSATYDQVENKTRDLEKTACEQVLADILPDSIIELGCGTGKNTEWLAEKATHLTCIDISEDMMSKAREKNKKSNVVFQQADITQPWNFTDRKADLVTCSLILEHIEDLEFIFQQVKDHLKENGHFYVCELHPFKQYSGSKARFETGNGTQVLTCYNHHISDYLSAAANNELTLVEMNEWFDDSDRSALPRLVSFLFSK